MAKFKMFGPISIFFLYEYLTCYLNINLQLMLQCAEAYLVAGLGRKKRWTLIYLFTSYSSWQDKEDKVDTLCTMRVCHPQKIVITLPLDASESLQSDLSFKIRDMCPVWTYSQLSSWTINPWNWNGLTLCIQSSNKNDEINIPNKRSN